MTGHGITAVTIGHSPQRSPLTFGQMCWLFMLFGAICLGLGYHALNRYDPRVTGGVNDSKDYSALVDQPIPLNPTSHRPYRILIPYVAKPAYWLINGRTGTWDPVFTALLASTSLFTSVSLVATVWLALKWGNSGGVALISALLLTLNYWVCNHYLVGMVDSAELCGLALIAVVLSMPVSKWYWLVPIFGVGALGKETLIIIGAAFVGAWTLWEVSANERRFRYLIAAFVWSSIAVATGLGAISAVRWAASAQAISPLALAKSLESRSTLTDSVIAAFFQPEFWYGIVWLVPLGLLGIRTVPKQWLYASLAAAAIALGLGIYHHAGAGNVARPMFSAMGPVLCVAAANFLTRSLCRPKDGDPVLPK